MLKFITYTFKSQFCGHPNHKVQSILQSWALALFPGFHSAQLLPMDRYRSIAHFADFHVRSSVNRSQKDQWFALIKERKRA